jgi:hypothetical protein
MPAGIGATGWVGLSFETVKGTFVAATTYLPVLRETLKYTEDKYYSQQLRQQVTDAEVKPGYYHVEGEIEMEVDPHYIGHFLYASRHSIVKTGAGPYQYVYTPTVAGATSTSALDTACKTLSITCVRNGVGFGYAGCTVGQFSFTIDGGVLKCTMTILGESEAEPVSLPTPSWLSAELLGADSHAVYLGASGTAPTYAADTSFNGFTLEVNHNAEAQNRIVPNRAATYVKYGKTDITVTSELDFISRADYDKFVTSQTTAIKLESTVGGTAYSGATHGIMLEVFRAAYDTYDINVESIDGIIMAGFTGHGLVQVGGSPYKISLKTPTNIGTST